MKAYRVKRAGRAADTVHVGEMLYHGCDSFGVANDDSRLLGEEYIAVSRHAKGEPFFTIRAADVEPIADVVDEYRRLFELVNTPHTNDFLEAVKLEAAHQRQRWGIAHDRSKSAENWFWLVGYLSGKALRAAIDGNREKALHHTISSGAALLQWHEAIHADPTGVGLGTDTDLDPETPP
jgi:hypothetical protein